MSLISNTLLQISTAKPSFGGDDLYRVLPELIVLVMAVLLVILDMFLPARSRPALGYLAILGYAGALVAAATLFYYGRPNSNTSFSGMFVRDDFSSFFEVIFLISGILVVLVTPSYALKRGIPIGETYAIQAFSVLGMMIVGASGDLMAIFVGIELTSICSYLLTGFARTDPGSAEGSLKYFLLGIFATAILVYGMAWTFGITGSTNLVAISQSITRNGLAGDAGLTFGMLMMVVGFGFKIAAVPFHVWTPDAYEGAPTPVTAFMSVGPKAAGFAALLRVLVQGLPALAVQWSVIIAVLAVLTMTLGNVVAIAQNSVKRMLAYSSIAHTGYIMVGLAAYLNTNSPDRQSDAISSVLIYSLIYVFMNMGAFAILIYVQNRTGGPDVDDFDGLASWAPGMALAMGWCLLSLTGIPPTGGFLGKFYVFRAAIDNGYTWLAIVGVLNSAVSAFFYLRIIYTMYFNPVKDEVKARLQPTRSGLITAGVVIISLALLLLGIFPDPALNLARDGADPLIQVVRTAAGH